MMFKSIYIRFIQLKDNLNINIEQEEITYN